MGKTIKIKQDSLITLKENLNEFMVDKNSKVASRDYVWFILFRGDLLFFDYQNKQLLDDFLHRHNDELQNFIYDYERKKYTYAERNFDNFVDWLGSQIPYLITGYISRGRDVYVNRNENYDVLNSNEFYQLVKKMPNSNFFIDSERIDTDEILNNKGQKMPDFWYHGTTFENALNIIMNGLKPQPDNSLYKIKHDKTVFISSNFRQAKWYANYKTRMSYGTWRNSPCVLKIDSAKLDETKIVYDYDVYNLHKIDRNDSVYNDRMKEFNLDYDNRSQTIGDTKDPRKYMKVGYRGVIMPNAVVSVYTVSYDGDLEMSKENFIKYVEEKRAKSEVKENVEADIYEIGQESDNPPLGGNACHVEESIEEGGYAYESKKGEKTMNENVDLEVDASDIDLSSFKKRSELAPIWLDDDTLDSRIRLRLLDIADDFWEFVNLTWVKPSGIVLTGSICNFNWSKYSDIDLHLIVDFDEIDEKTEFVQDYLDAKKNEWNNEHSDLTILGFPVELYVQNLESMPKSGGIYDLEENVWIKKPNASDIKPIGLDKFSIKDKAAEIMTIIDDMYNTLNSEGDSHRIEEIGEDAHYLWKKIKKMRKDGLETSGESSPSNIVYKILRRVGYLDKLWKLRTRVYDKSNSITESKSKKKKYTVYIDGKKDDTFSDINWKRKPKVGKGFYYGGAVFKIKKVTDDSIYAIEESKSDDKEIIKEYLEKDYNLPLYKYFKWASTASSCEKARDLAYSCCYYINEYIRKIYYRYSEFEDLLNDGEFDYEDESLVEMFLNMLEENKLCDHFISEMQSIVDYYELPSWCTMGFNRVVKNEWCIHFGSDSESIAKEGFTGGTPDIERLAYTNAGVQKSSAGYDFAFSINDRSVDYNGYGDEAVIFRTSGVEIFHYGDNQNQVVFWGPNVKSFIPIHQDNGDWVVYGQNGQVLVRCSRPSEIALWATENLPQYRKQIMTGKNGYTPMMSRWNSDTNKVERKPYPLYRNESVKKLLTLLKEETVADGSSTTNPYKQRWKAEREALKNFVANYGKLMQSKEDDKGGKLYKVFYDKTMSNLIGYNYCICVQWDEIQLKPKSTVYIRALDKFTPFIRRNLQYDNRGMDNVRGTMDDTRTPNYGAYGA